MGYVLLWIEQLAAVILLVATLVAYCSHLRQFRLRVALSVLVAVVPLIAYGFLVWGLSSLRSKLILIGVFYPLVSLTVCYVIGAVGILYSGLRQRGDDSTLAAATNWPRGRLALMLAVATGLHMMTWWNLDLSVNQQLATLQAESAALGLSVAPARLPDRENAALVYELAYEAFDRDSWSEARTEKWEKWNFSREGFAPDDPDLHSFLDEQESALMLLRQAGRKPGCHFGRNYGRLTIDLLMPELSGLRDAARLLALDARVRAAEGEMQVALEDVGTMFAIVEHVGSEHILISTLVAIAINNIATDTLEEVLLAAGKLGGEEAVTVELLNTIDLDGSLSFQRIFGRSLRAEKASALNVFQLAYGYSQDGLAAELAGVRNWNVVSHSFFRLFMATSDVASFRNQTNTFSQITAKAYHEARKELEKFDSDFKSRPKGIVTALLMPALSRAVESAARADARHRTARLALAAASYRADHGNLPESLDALVPDYMAIIPRDPFDGKPMKYLVTDDGAIIYTIGSDGKTIDNRVGDRTFELKR